MAVAFYIPDQEDLLRKSKEQEKQILKMREIQWKLIATVALKVLKRYYKDANTKRSSNKKN